MIEPRPANNLEVVKHYTYLFLRLNNLKNIQNDCYFVDIAC